LRIIGKDGDAVKKTSPRCLGPLDTWPVKNNGGGKQLLNRSRPLNEQE